MAGAGFGFRQFENGKNLFPVLPAMAGDVDEIAINRFGHFQSGRLQMVGAHP